MTTQQPREVAEAQTLLVRHAELVATMDDGDGRIPDGGVYVVGNVIRQVGPTAELPATADEVIDARGMVVLPGLVNTHHHFSQTLTRADCGVSADGARRLPRDCGDGWVVPARARGSVFKFLGLRSGRL